MPIGGACSPRSKLVIIQLYQEKSKSVSFFALGLDMAIALDIAMAISMDKASSLL